MRRAGLLLLALLPLAGCGFGAGEATGDVTLTVTRDFGATRCTRGPSSEKAVRGRHRHARCCSATTTSRPATAAASCRRSTACGRARERPPGRLVLLRQRHRGARRRRRAPRSPRGERVWWDHHDWQRRAARPRGRRLVPGAVPSGTEGKRFPVRLVCLGDDERSCDEVADAPRGRGHQGQLTRATLEQSGGQEVLRVIVGRWADVRARPGRALARARPADERASSRSRQQRRRDRAARRRRRGRAHAARRRRTGRGHQRRGAGADLDRHRDRRRRRRRRRGGADRGTADQHFALAVDDGQDVPLPVAGPGRGRDRDPPPPGQPAARRARRDRRAVVHHARARRAVVRASDRARRRCSGCSPPRRGARGPRGRPRAGVGAAAGAGDRADQRARRARRPDGRVPRPVLPGIGRLDVTAEALAYGGVLGAARASRSSRCAALLAAAVDPDELLRAVRRRSLRIGVTAALATHLVGVLARDGAPARRRPAHADGGAPAPRRLGVVRAVAAGALDRATDVAATLEVRGFGSGGRPARRAGRRRATTSRSPPPRVASRCCAIASGVGGWEGFEAYPRLVGAGRAAAARARGRARRRASCCRSPTAGGSA